MEPCQDWASSHYNTFNATGYLVTAFPPFYDPYLLLPFKLNYILRIPLIPEHCHITVYGKPRQDVYVRKKLDRVSDAPLVSSTLQLTPRESTCNSLQRTPQTTANMHEVMTFKTAFWLLFQERPLADCLQYSNKNTFHVHDMNRSPLRSLRHYRETTLAFCFYADPLAKQAADTFAS